MKTPTLEEVKARFKDAEIVKDYYLDEINMTEMSSKGIYQENGFYYVDDKQGECYSLWSRHNGYAKIIKKKPNARLVLCEVKSVNTEHYSRYECKYKLENFNGTPPASIEVNIEPQTLKEFIEFNNLTESKALEILKNNL